jgi:glucose-6-phosphate isomerase
MSFYQQEIKNLPKISDKLLSSYLQKVKIAKDEIIDEIKNNNIPPLNIAAKIDDLEEIQNLANTIKSNFKKVVILGVGGSSLGAKTICAIKNQHDVEIDFFESIDGDTIKNKLDKVSLKETFFVVISKSGQTIETICQTLIIIEEFKKNNISQLSKQFIFITQNKDSDIGKIASEINAKVKDHPSDIGGRFSYLTIVGLLPAALIGFDIRKIRQGANKILEDFLTQDVTSNKISTICAYQLYLFDKGFHSNVVMPYIDLLKDFTDWYRQLWAESLGKDGFGSTPINSMGTVDQHSQLQLYLDGPRDKFFTFITNKNPTNNFIIKDLENYKTRFGGKNLNQIVAAEQESTIEILAKQDLPIRVIELEKVNEESLSALMMKMFLETILVAKVKKINPFDQPAVELRKILSKEYLDNDS